MAEFRTQMEGKRPASDDIILSCHQKKSRSLSQKLSDKARSKTRVNIGLAFERWRSLRAAKEFKTDEDLAFFLLDCYEKGPVGPPSDHEEHKGEDTDESTMSASEVQGLLERADWTSEGRSASGGETESVQEDDDSSDEDCAPFIHIGLDGATAEWPNVENLPVITADEMVHDLPAEVIPPVAETVLPEPLKVQCEEDIVGARASIIYEESLRQLALSVTLPVRHCPYTEDGVVCDCGPPFEVIITTRSTASIAEWVCYHGHTVWKWSSQPTMKFGMQAGDFMLATNILLSGNNYAKVAILFEFMNMGIVNPNTFSKIQDAYCVDTIKEFCVERGATADFEAFQNHIPTYASKGFSYAPPVYEARVLLASLDYNYHQNRPPRLTADGKIMHKRLYKKNAKRWNVYTMKTPKTYGYIPELQARIVKKRLSSDTGMPIRRSLRPDDPRRLDLSPTSHC
ncbi:uncharacterized protein ACJ7VT_006459 [Polymixia lowei]